MNKYTILLMLLLILSLPIIMNFKLGDPAVNNSKSNLLMTLNIESNDAIIRFLDDKTGIGIVKDGKVVLNNLDTANFIYKDKANNTTYKLENFRLLGANGLYYLVSEGHFAGKFISLALPCYLQNQGSTINIPAHFNNYTNLALGEGNTTGAFSLATNGNIDGVSRGNHNLISDGGKSIYSAFILNLDSY